MLFWALSVLGLSAAVTGGNNGNRLLTDHLASNRTARDIPCPPNEYLYDGLCCVNCPTGTHVSAHCTVNDRLGHCSPCTPGKDFTAAPNGMDSCLSCRPCRFDDQEQVAECTAVGDYQCQCKPNTFCTDLCHYCKDCTRCPQGQHVKHECTPTSDTVCEDKRSIYPTAQVVPNHSLTVALPVSIGFIFLLFLSSWIYWKKKQKDKKKLTRSTNENYQSPLFQDFPEVVSTAPVIAQPVQEREDNLGVQDTNSPLGQQDKEDFIPVGIRNQCGVTKPKAPCDKSTMNPMDKRVPGLEPCTCVCDQIKIKGDPVLTEEEWLQCYNCLKGNVPPVRWKEMIRHLGLSEVEIQHILLNHNDIREANYQMFLSWRYQNGQHASMSKVLHVLDQMNLYGCKENVANGLMCNGVQVSI